MFSTIFIYNYFLYCYVFYVGKSVVMRGGPGLVRLLRDEEQSTRARDSMQVKSCFASTESGLRGQT